MTSRQLHYTATIFDGFPVPSRPTVKVLWALGITTPVWGSVKVPRGRPVTEVVELYCYDFSELMPSFQLAGLLCCVQSATRLKMLHSAVAAKKIDNNTSQGIQARRSTKASECQNQAKQAC